MQVTETEDTGIEVTRERDSQLPPRASELATVERPVLLSLEDHFTLPTPSNVVRFRARRNAARVYDSKGVQMVMEETYDNDKQQREITVRRLSDITAGLTFLRASYSIVCALWTGFFFVFCLQVLLFLVLDLAIQSGATAIDAEVHTVPVIAVVLAIIVFVHGFSEAMVIAGHYILDTWSGHFLAKQFIFGKFSDVAIEWVFFFFFLLAPLVVMCSMLLATRDDWWSITAIFWFGCVMGFFVIFCANIVFYEVKAAYDFVKNQSGMEDKNWRHVVFECVKTRQIYKYSGKKKSTYLARNFFQTTEDTEAAGTARVYEETRRNTLSWWSRITRTLPSSLFATLDEPTRLYTIEDVQDYRPFLTRHTWNLEGIFCRPKNSRYIAIVNGPGSLTRAQLRSSLVCSLIGSLLIVLMVVSLMVWFRTPGVFLAFALAMSIVMLFLSLRQVRALFKVGQDIVQIRTDLKERKAVIDNLEEGSDVEIVDFEADDDGGVLTLKDNEDSPAVLPRGFSKVVWDKAGTSPSEALFLVVEYSRVTEATEKFCAIMFVLEVCVFFVFPAVVLLLINLNIGILFVLVSTISGIRHYINAAVVIEETGNMELVGGSTPEEKWENKSRLNEIIQSITVGKSRKVWTSILGVGGFAFLALFLGAVGQSTENTSQNRLTYLPNHYYPPLADGMRYPTCTLNSINGGFGENSTMLDYAFLASLAYRPNDITKDALTQWFNKSTIAMDGQAKVDNFRARRDKGNAAVFFKLFSFPETRTAIISIRGTSNNWDMLADSQLWSAAALMQGLRAILPAGEIWSPILDQLVNWINTLQSSSLEKVSFYTLTREFAEELKKDPDFDHVQVTGHSLGGGLSMITGAQAKIPAVALSGPNAIISGASFNPKVTAEDLNKYTFNIIPNKDIVPMLDDVADQFQRIRCMTPAYNFVDCHTSTRSVCEIMYSCGTGNRPAICECHRTYGYPKPITDGEEIFDDLCP